MNVNRVDFESGWCDVECGLSESEIDVLVRNLLRLKKRETETDHFHIVMDYAADSRVADIEFHIKSVDAVDNMSIDGVPRQGDTQ